MPQPIANVELRIHSLQSVLANADERGVVDSALQEAKGDWTVAWATLKERLPSTALQKVAFAHSLAEWSGDSLPVIKALAEQPNLTTLREVALRYNTERLTTLVDPHTVPDTTPGDTPAEKAKNFAVGLQRKLFSAEPSAVVQRMVQDNEVPISDPALRTNVSAFLNNQPDFNIRNTSIYSAFRQPDAFKGISNDQRPLVVEQLKTLQRVQALTPIPEAIPTLMKANLTSAFRVAEIPESTFMGAHGPSLGADTAKQIYTHAVNAHIRNEHALMTMRESVRGSGLAIIDGQEPMEMRMAEMQKVADKHEAQLNLEALFGNMDFCECGECTSVYSPASYFVDLLQYLRNNNLDPKNSNTGTSGIAGTPLEKLFRRRPDLGCLELTCVNTNTVLPYIDLVNEVMESFVVHLGQYHADTNDPKQATLDVFNVVDETSSELLAQPQHTNYEAYCTLKSAVYPFTLPYHQPIDAIRIFLDYLGTSRWELLDTYRAACCIEDSSAFTRDEQEELKKLCTVILDRAVDAEFLGLTQEEYIILTKEAFWPKRYFDLTQHKAYTDDDYRQNIGVKPVHVYYGYGSEPDMLSLDETKKIGLTFVKKQFLPRTGILYVDLIELLKTRFINPNFPQGKALTLLESIRFSYRFLQTLVDTSSANPAVRFAKLVEFLEKTQPLLPVLDAMLHPDPCHQHKPDHCSCLEGEDLRGWVHCYFERIGKLIVLESGEGPHLPIAGKIVTEDAPPVFVGNLRPDGMIVDEQGKMVGTVDILGRVLSTDGKLLVDKLGASELRIEDEEGKLIGSIHANGIQGPREERITWLPAQETCDLDKVRLTHLDDTSVTVSEYDRIHRFIRLWRKLGWTIDETDKALGGWSDGQHSAVAGAGTSETTEEHCEPVSFDIFTEACEIPAGESDEDCEPCGGEWDCPDPAEALEDITPDFLHQLVAIKKLLDLTGLPLPKLLAFWADISTVGEKSLYSGLFLTHNLLGIDKVFKADKNGDYLTQSAKISNHLPVLMAAFRLKADDITSIVAFRKLSDALTLSNVSVLYRHSLLAKILHVKVPELAEVIALFGDPFISADQTVHLLETWGKMEDAGFTFWQLNCLIRDQDDPLRPLAPSEKTILQLSKTLYDGLNGIDRDHKDLGPNDEATSDLVRAKAGLLFEQSIVEQILGLLEGTTIYSTNAPAGLTINVPEPLAKKLQYAQQKDAVPPAAILQTVGILTDGEKASALALSNHPKWPDAIGRVGKQAQNIFNDALLGVFPDVANAKTQLLKGDFANPDNAQDPANTAPQKRLYFMNAFLPFLRKQLAQRLITDTTSTAASLPADATSELLKNILWVGPTKLPAMQAFEAIKVMPTASSGWKGYLIPTADADYTFIAVGDTQPSALLLDGQSIPFAIQQEDPSNVWFTDPSKPAKLRSGKLYWLEISDRPAEQLQWKTPASSKTPIPTSALLPDFASQATQDAFLKLYKAAILINGFNLSVDEITYWQSHSADFDGFDFNAPSLTHWKRWQAYADLRDYLPKTDTSLLDLFTWATKPDDPTKLSAKVADATRWKTDNIDKLLTPMHFDLNRPEAFRNEKNLVILRKALQVAGKIGMDINRLFDWAKPGSKFWNCHTIAEDIRKAIRARFDQEDWEKVVKPLNDQLREHQKQALIAYLLVQQDLIDWGVVDADSLFEFFLIDVQMDACMETSRIKQAISTVQLFVQRCFLGLEEPYGVPNNVLDRDRWKWMQKYRVWEANRKVFLYPENWIEPTLRDDKSPFYKELESELLQKDVNPQTVQDALKSYLFKVDEVANLKVVGLFLDEENSKLHIFSRTRNAPYFFYYRYFNTAEKNWYPWEKVQVDIPTYEEEGAGKITDHGTYLIPVVWNNRLLLFW